MVINKMLGNIKKAHKHICFIGLLNTRMGKSKLVHYLADEGLYDDVHVPKDEADMDENQLEFYHNKKKQKAESENLKQRTEKIIDMAL